MYVVAVNTVARFFFVLFSFPCFLDAVMRSVLASYTIKLTQQKSVLVASQNLLGNAIAVNGELTKTLTECQGHTFLYS